MKLGAVAAPARPMALASEYGNACGSCCGPQGMRRIPPKKVITTQQLLALVNAQPKKKG